MSEPSPSSPPRLTRFARTAGLAGLEASSIGFAVWLIVSHAALPEYFHDNTLGEGQRKYVLLDMGAGIAVAIAIAGILVVWRRRQGAAIVERLARRLAPLTLVWMIPFIFDRRIWFDEALLILPIILAGAWTLVATLRVSWATEPAFPGLSRALAERRQRMRARLARATHVVAAVVTPLRVVVLGAVAYAFYFSAFSIVNHRNLGTRGFDLGLEDNLVWHVLRPSIPLFKSTVFSPHGTHFGNHVTWLSYLIAPIYALVPGPETLLVVQACLMGAAAIPLYLYASRHVPAWIAVLVAYLYLFYPPLHGANLYDFHYLPLGVVFLWTTLYAAESRRTALTVVGALVCLSVREDVALCLAVMGIFLLLTGAAARAGVLLAVAGGLYFLGMKLYLMPRYGGTESSFLNQYSGLVADDEHGFAGALKTIVANPAFTANYVFERDKVRYVLELFVPLLVLPATRPIAALLVGPGVLFTLFSTGYWPLYQTSFQYTSYWTAFVFVGLVLALEHAGKQRDGVSTRRPSLLFGLAAASLACTHLYGGILHHQSVRAGFGVATFGTSDADRKNRADVAALVRQIPADAKVVASDRLVPHVSTRDAAYALFHGVEDADWILFELSLNGDERSKLAEALTDPAWGVVDQRGSFVLAKKGAPPAQNFYVLQDVMRH